MRNGAEKDVRGLRTPRERIWAAVCAIPDDELFTCAQITARCVPSIRDVTARNYLTALRIAGYLERGPELKLATGFGSQAHQWRLVKRQYEAPRLSRDGEPVSFGGMQQAMWIAMKVLKCFDHQQVAHAASMPPALVVSADTARTYVASLQKAGYLQTLRKAERGLPAVYRLAKNTGPHAPAQTIRKCVLDRNTGEVFELQSAQEVCDALPE